MVWKFHVNMVCLTRDQCLGMGRLEEAMDTQRKHFLCYALQCIEGQGKEWSQNCVTETCDEPIWLSAVRNGQKPDVSFYLDSELIISTL